MWRTFSRRIPTATSHPRTLSTYILPHEKTKYYVQKLNRRIVRLSLYYGRKSNDSVFKVLNRLSHEAEPAHASQLSGCQLSELARWEPVMTMDSWDAIMQYLELQGLPVSSANLSEPLDPCPHLGRAPTWVILYLLCYKVASRWDVCQAVSLVHHHISAALPHLRPILLILLAGRLAEHELLIPLQRTIQTYLNLPELGTELDVESDQVLLRLLASAAPSKSFNAVILSVLSVFEARQVPLTANTYNALLKSKLVTAEIGRKLMEHMDTTKYEPSAKQLTRLLALFTAQQPSGAQQRQWVIQCLRALKPHLAAKRTSPTMTSLISHRPLSMVTTVGALYPEFRKAMMAEPVAEGSLTNSPEIKVSSSDEMANMWRTAIRVAARDSNVSADDLLVLYDHAIAHCPAMFQDVATHMFAMRGFITRAAVSHALHIWEHVCTQRILNSKWALSVCAQNLVACGRPDEAFDVLCNAVLEGNNASGVHKGVRTRKLVDMQTMTAFMVALEREGYLDAVFALWERMDVIFGVHPDVYTLTLILKTARLASRNSSLSVRGALAELGLGGLFQDRSPNALLSTETARDQAIKKIQSYLEPQMRNASKGLWKGARAGTTALRLVHQILLENYPDLHAVSSPVKALRPSADFPAYFPVTDLFRSVTGRSLDMSPGNRLASSVSSTPHGVQSFPGVPSHPQVIPTEPFFRAYLDLLRAESLVPYVPLALAWMRHLGIVPKRNTLAVALVYWGEVSMDAPLLESWKGGRNEYIRLVEWMRGWVGHDGMPTDADIGWNIRQLRDFREGRNNWETL